MRSQPTILAFDTSAAHCAAALLLGDKIVTRVDEMAKGQAEHLMPMLEEILAGEDLSWRDVDAVGVGVGPGNFTGIRIAVAAARGLALGLRIPAIGVSTLEAQIDGLDMVLASCLRAPRDRLYIQGFNRYPLTDPNLSAFRRDDLLSLPERAEPRVCGDCADEVATLTGWQPIAPLASPIEGIARIARRRMHSSKDRPTPLYIRKADAAPPRDPAPVILP